MLIEVITPEKTLFSGEATVATFPGTEGSFQVMNNHSPLVSTLQAGTIVLKSDNGDKELNVLGGVVEVNKNKIIVLAEQ